RRQETGEKYGTTADFERTLQTDDIADIAGVALTAGGFDVSANRVELCSERLHIRLGEMRVFLDIRYSHAGYPTVSYDTVGLGISVENVACALLQVPICGCYAETERRGRGSPWQLDRIIDGFRRDVTPESTPPRGEISGPGRNYPAAWAVFALRSAYRARRSRSRSCRALARIERWAARRTSFSCSALARRATFASDSADFKPRRLPVAGSILHGRWSAPECAV